MTLRNIYFLKWTVVPPACDALHWHSPPAGTCNFTKTTSRGSLSRGGRAVQVPRSNVRGVRPHRQTLSKDSSPRGQRGTAESGRGTPEREGNPPGGAGLVGDALPVAPRTVLRR